MLDFSQVHFGPRKFLDARRRELAALEFDRIRVMPIAPVIGAVLEGPDLREPLDDETFREVERALHEFKVIFFNDQDVTEAQQAAFASRFGELEEHPFLPSPEGKPEVIRFAKDEETVAVENAWHSDVSWREIPSLGSVLRARKIPEIGGDTLWADMESAYEGLTDELKEKIEGAVAVHDFVNSFGLGMTPERRAEMSAKFPPVEHPVVRTHAATGRRSIFV
ncbi:MAG: TauD/TfdA family dioxygenase, partial [Deltaproteobacteria bacterium]|nr:TauD/TfdA family dioxygenase [Deltaproteobacteria bacterium]